MRQHGNDEVLYILMCIKKEYQAVCEDVLKNEIKKIKLAKNNTLFAGGVIKFEKRNPKYAEHQEITMAQFVKAAAPFCSEIIFKVFIPNLTGEYLSLEAIQYIEKIAKELEVECTPNKHGDCISGYYISANK